MKAVLIGLGMVADTHLAALHASQTVDLHGVLGRRRETTEAYAEKASTLLGRDILTYESVAAVASDAEVDFAIVATPPDSHSAIVSQLADAGKPVLLEKPIERTLDAAQALVVHCERAAVPLGVVLQHRAREVSHQLKSAVSTGELGQIIAADIRVPWWRDQSYYDAPGRGTYDRDGGGVLITQAIHTIDLALWLLGPMARVQALLRRTAAHELEAEDWAGAVFTTEDGVAGTLMATTACYPGTSESILLQGTKGTALLQGNALQISAMKKDTVAYGAISGSGGGADPMAFTHDWHQTIIEDFAASVRSGNVPIAAGKSALMAHAAIEAIERSNRRGERVHVRQV